VPNLSTSEKKLIDVDENKWVGRTSFFLFAASFISK